MSRAEILAPKMSRDCAKVGDAIKINNAVNSSFSTPPSPSPILRRLTPDRRCRRVLELQPAGSAIPAASTLCLRRQAYTLGGTPHHWPKSHRGNVSTLQV